MPITLDTHNLNSAERIPAMPPKRPVAPVAPQSVVLHCPVRGPLTASALAKDGLTPSEEAHRVDFLRFLIEERGYPEDNIAVETVVIKKIGEGGRNKLRADVIVYNRPVAALPAEGAKRLAQAILVAEIKRESARKQSGMAFQLIPALMVLPRLDVMGVYWDAESQVLLTKTVEGKGAAREVTVKTDTIANLPQFGEAYRAKKITIDDRVLEDGAGLQGERAARALGEVEEVGAPLQRDFFHEDFRAFLARFPGTADLIVTSPPYVDARTPEAYGVDKPWTAQDDRDLGDAMFHALRPGGTAFVVVGAPVRKWRKGHGTERGLEPVRWLIDLVDRVGFTCRDVLAYHRSGNVGEYRGRFRPDFEPVLWLERPGGEPAFDKNPLNEPAIYGTRGGGGTRKPDGTMRVRQKSGYAAENGIKRRGTVWTYPGGGGTAAPPEMIALGHSAPFPLKTAEDAVACFSKLGDLVLDPFSGRGTTALACARLGRRFAGGDLGRARDGRSWAEVAREVVAALAPPHTPPAGPPPTV